MDSAEQLMLPLPSIHKHYYSPTFIRFWDAWFDFESEISMHVRCVHHNDNECCDYDCWEDDKIMTGVPVRIEDQSTVTRDELELWTARLSEAIRLLKCGKYDMFYTIRNEII